MGNIVQNQKELKSVKNVLKLVWKELYWAGWDH